MTPKPTSFRLEPDIIEKLAALAKHHKRSQGKELEFLIEQAHIEVIESMPMPRKKQKQPPRESAVSTPNPAQTPAEATRQAGEVAVEAKEESEN